MNTISSLLKFIGNYMKTTLTQNINPADFIEPSSGWTFKYIKVAQSGSVMNIAFVASRDTDIPNGTQLNIGAIKSDYRPATVCPLISVRSVGVLDGEGRVYIRNVSGASITANTELTYAATFIKRVGG